MKKIVLIIVVLLCVTISYSQKAGDKFMKDNIAYKVTSVNPNTVEITAETTATGVVEIPETVKDDKNSEYRVTSIGTSAFYNNLLTSVTIPDSVKSIGNSAFSVNLLTNVTIADSVKSIGSSAFSDNALISLVIPDGVTAIGGRAFQYNDLTSVTIGKNLKAIGNYAFSNNALTSVVIPDGITTIGEAAFNDNALTSAVIPDSVNFIGNYAFSNNALTSVVIPDGVTVIGVATFESNNIASVTIPNSVKTIGYDAFAYNALTGIVIGNNVTYIGAFAFRENPLVQITVKATTSPVIEATSFGDYSNRADIALVIPPRTKEDYTEKGWTGFESIVADFSVDNINYQVISSEDNTVKIVDSPLATGDFTIPETVKDNDGIVYTVTAIGSSAFRNNSLTSVTIPEGVVSIGDSAFFNNDLTNVTIPDSVTTIEVNAFSENALTSIVLPDSVTIIGYRAFDDNPSLAEVIVKAITPPVIEATSFGDRANIDLIIPYGKKEAYEAAGWTGFKSVTEADALSIGDTFTKDNIAYKVTSVDPNTVEITSETTATGVVKIPETVKDNDDIVYNVTTIGEGAFFDNALTSVTIPDSVKTIESYAFENNGLRSVAIGNNVTTIGYAAFSDNALTSLTIPDSVKTIESYAFDYNQDLQKVSLLGDTPAEIEADSFTLRGNITLDIVGNVDLEDLKSAGWVGFKGDIIVGYQFTLIYDSGVKDPMKVNYEITSLDPGNKTVMVIGGIPLTTNEGQTNQTKEIDIPETVPYDTIEYSVTSIRDYALSGKDLTSVIIPEGVTSIGYYAFAHNALTSVTIPKNVASIGEGIFSNNPLTEVSIKASIPPTIDIEGDSFGDRANIDLIIPYGKKEAYEVAGWTGFKSVTEAVVLSMGDTTLKKDAVTLLIRDNQLQVTTLGANLKYYTIYSITGAKVLNGSQNTVSIAHLPHGVYIAVLTLDKGVISKKFAK